MSGLSPKKMAKCDSETEESCLDWSDLHDRLEAVFSNLEEQDCNTFPYNERNLDKKNKQMRHLSRIS